MTTNTTYKDSELLPDEVMCPNLCLDGYIKHYPENDKALFVTVKCPFCKGKGHVHKMQVDKIKSMI